MAKEWDTEQRREAESRGDTAYGESFPMETCEDVRNAIHAYGRAPVEHRAQVRRKIIQRNRELGCGIELPEGWQA
jgi:hypothetical protein